MFIFAKHPVKIHFKCIKTKSKTEKETRKLFFKKHQLRIRTHLISDFGGFRIIGFISNLANNFLSINSAEIGSKIMKGKKMMMSLKTTLTKRLKSTH